jgi:uncharacterized membrane protein
MIELTDPAEGRAGVAIRLRPNRSASPAELVAFFSAIALVALGVALFAASQGNVYAPVFAVLDVGVVGASFWLVRKGLSREEVISLTPEAVTIRRRPGNLEATFNPWWVKLETKPGRTSNEPVRVLMGSHGRSIEVGVFLTEAERLELRDRLQEALAATRAGDEPGAREAAGS